MRKQESLKKLSLNKETIAKLDESKMNDVKGGFWKAAAIAAIKYLLSIDGEEAAECDAGKVTNDTPYSDMCQPSDLC